VVRVRIDGFLSDFRTDRDFRIAIVGNDLRDSRGRRGIVAQAQLLIVGRKFREYGKPLCLGVLP
jgi:hypothetical protein